MTEEKIRDEFITKLKTLLHEYDAVLSAKDHYQGYPECGEDVRMTVDIDGIYSEDGDIIRPYMDIDLGAYIDGKL